jgi:hypothetical protein
MTKKDIKKGDIVLLEDGRRCIVMPDINDPNKRLVLYGVLNLHNIVLCFDKLFGIIASLHYYDDDLTDNNGYTIMAVRKNPIGSAACLFEMLTNDSIDKDRFYWDWKREEVKEVTMAEVEEKFGCKVKIVKEEK